MKHRAQLWATYRLLSNAKVSHTQLSRPHWQATRQATAEHPIVLISTDTTELDFTPYWKTMQGLAPIGDGNGRGLLLLTCLAVVPTSRAILGIAYQHVFKRVPHPPGVARRKRPKAKRESRVWGEGVQALGRPPEGTRWVLVADSAADHTDLLLTCRQTGIDFNVRLAYEDRVAVDAEVMDHPAGERHTVFGVARSWAAQASYTLAIPARDGQPARQAQMAVSYGRVTFRVPKGTAPLTVWVVRAWEVDAPPDVEALEWVLATSVPVETEADALERVTWYTRRWLSEDYHQCLKTGCQVEHRDLEHADRIERLLGFLALIAVRLLQLRETARHDPELPASAVVDPLMVKLLAARLNIPVDMNARTFWRSVAQLGGYLGRRGDGPPGWKTLWRGWLYLETLVHGARLAASIPDG